MRFSGPFHFAGAALRPVEQDAPNCAMTKAATSGVDGVSGDEAEQLERAFGDRDFRSLFAEYVKELSDPASRREQEAYLSQLESQNETPRGKKLIRPAKGFVLKCLHRKRRDASATRRPAKLFVNVVHSEEVAAPSASERDGGTSWSLPHALGPLRMEQDKRGSLVPTFDCCFHPNALRLAHGSEEFRSLAVDTAKNAVAEAFRRSGDEVDMVPGYAILKGVRYNAGDDAKALLVPVAHSGLSRPAAAEREEAHVPAATNDETSRAAVKPRVETAGGGAKGQATGKEGAGGNKKGGAVTPKYTITERDPFDISGHSSANSRPGHLIVRVELDGADSAADVALDVSELVVEIEPARSAEVKYRLSLTLPYPVDPQRGRARFDRAKKVLSLDLPCVNQAAVNDVVHSEPPDV